MARAGGVTIMRYSAAALSGALKAEMTEDEVGT